MSLSLLRRRAVVAGATALALVGGAGVAVAVVNGGADAAATLCPDGRHLLRVVAAGEIAGVVESLVDPASTRPDDCGRIEVRAADPAVAAAEPKDADVWIPDSSSWVTSAPRRPAPSLATSPVVVAVTTERAPDGRAPSALTLLTAADAADTDGAALRLVLGDPRRSASAAALVAGLDAGATRPASRAALTQTLRTAVPVDAPAASLLETLTPDHAVVVPEQAVWTHNAAGPARTILATYGAAGRAVLDYPFVTLATEPAVVAAADRLRSLLSGPSGRAALASAGFRDPDGRFPADPAAPTGISTAPLPAPVALAPTTARTASDALAALGLGSRMLAVIDVSGSMGERVDGGPRRLDLVKDAAASGLSVLPKGSEIGLWVFSRSLDGDTDHRSLAPIARLDRVVGGTPQSSLLLSRLESTQHVVGGGTGLYDTTLAAVREVRAGWDPRRVNSVVVITDGKDDDPEGIGLRGLLRALAAEADPLRQVPVNAIAYGPDADSAALRRIAAATEGAAYAAPRPAQIRDVFLDAVGRRLCRPDC